MKFTIEKIENGYLVTDGEGKRYIANSMHGFSGVSLVDVLRRILEKEEDGKEV